jgi:Protein of unknown function (DUF3485)
MDSNLPKRIGLDWKWVRALCLWSCCVLTGLGLACSPADNQDEVSNQDKTSLSKVYKFTSDTSHYFSTSHEGKFVSNTNYLYRPNLEHLPWHLGDWEGWVVQSDDPNILYQRYYEDKNSGAGIYLMAVHGTNESQFHTPEVCYIGDGWKVEERRYKSINLRDEVFQVRYAIAKKGEFRHLILYWYLWPDSRRNITDGLVMLRLSVIIDPSLEDAEQNALEFIQQLADLKLNMDKSEVAETFTPVLPIVDSGKKPVRTEWTPYKEKAVAWLKSQIVPNSIVKEPAQDRRNLLISYKVPKDSEVYRYVFSKASLYDNALAVIAFSMVGEYRLAERIIEASSRILSPDNDLWFTFNTHNSWPNKNDHSGAIIRSGASAWLGYAITFYLKTRLTDNPNLLQQDNEAMNHLKLAQSIADKILLRQITDPADPRYGFFTGGEGRYSYRWDKENHRVEEYFIPGSIPWASIEHNIDIFFLLRDLAVLTGKKKYASPANTLKQSLVIKSWNEKTGQLNRGQRLDGADSAQALDCASWGAVFLQAVGDDIKALTSLNSTANYLVRSKNRQGYKPYVDLLLYEDPEINGLFYPDAPEKNWNDLPLIWPEGSLGVAMAFLKMKKNEQAVELIKSMIKLQDNEGGMPYATENLRYQFSRNSSVAGTAWLVMVISALEDENALKLFWQG